MPSGFYGQYLDVEGVFKTEYDLIRRYREMSLHPEVDSAIEDIVNEAIVADQNDSPVQIDLENLNARDKLKKLFVQSLNISKRCWILIKKHMKYFVTGM